MNAAEWFTFLSYTIVTAITPGPNNILALSATSRCGVQKSKYLLLGILCGFLSVMALCCGCCTMMATILPSVTACMKYVGAIYIAWLAWRIAVSKPTTETESSANDLSFWDGFLLQWVNAKIILCGITIFSAYILPHQFSAAILGGYVLLSTVIGGSGTMLWALAGEAFSGFLQKRWRSACIIMASLLFANAASLMLS